MIERLIEFSIRNRWLVIVAGLLLALAGLYAVYHTPMDAIPDVLLGVGMTDDMAVFASTLKAIAGHLTAEHYDQAREWLNS